MKLDSLSDLSNGELLAGLEASVGDACRVLARLLAYLAEVEHRRLHLDAACSSMFEYCVRRLGMSDGEAFRRITAARLARSFPVLLEKVSRGEIHLSAVVLLRDHLTNENSCGADPRGMRQDEVFVVDISMSACVGCRACLHSPVDHAASWRSPCRVRLERTRRTSRLA